MGAVKRRPRRKTWLLHEVEVGVREVRSSAPNQVYAKRKDRRSLIKQLVDNCGFWVKVGTNLTYKEAKLEKTRIGIAVYHAVKNSSLQFRFAGFDESKLDLWVKLIKE